MTMELRKAHAANDAAVLKAYGWPTDLSEPEIVSRLFDMYAKLTATRPFAAICRIGAMRSRRNDKA